MDNSQNSASSSSPGVSLPPGFLTVKQIQDLPSPALRAQQKVNIIGFVKDFQPPKKTKGTDFKCTIDIVDSSLPFGSYGLKVNVFSKPERRSEMPIIGGAGDVVLIRNIKAQMYAGAVSLLSQHTSTEFHVLPASKIPTAASEFSEAPWKSHPPSKGKRPTAAEVTYVVWANSKANDLGLPSTQEFQERSIQAMNVKNKFSLLKDVASGGFHDILGEVVKVYSEAYESATVYLSDYTENSQFYNYAWGDQALNGREGDPHNYIKSRQTATKDAWPGPYGKRTIQLTLWDGHAYFTKDQVKVGNWILLRNVQIKYGKSGGHLEGFLRGDPNSFEGKVQVEIMEQSEEPENNDPRWKDALMRRREYEKKFKQQEHDILDEDTGKKRKREDEASKGNSKARRKERRAAGVAKAAAAVSKVMKKLDLNEHVRSSFPNEPALSLTEILKPRNLPIHAESGRDQLSPFHLCKYKANLRVVGFFPPKIEDFAVWRRPSEYDMLSDYSGGEDTDREGDMREWRSGKGLSKKIWEWRFALEVIDASSKASKKWMWLMVENQDAQMLLNMNATNLRKDVNTLREVKEKLCILWGDLEEQKSALAHAKAPKAPIKPTSSPPPSHMPGDQPPVDSDDEDENSHSRRKQETRSANASALSERDLNATMKGEVTDGDPKSSGELRIKNKGFTCCIKQYGVKVKEKDPSLANAGNGKRWERRFGLFGTQIV